MGLMQTQSTTSRRGRTGSPIRAVLNLFSSIRFGIALIAALILYSTIGSAIPPARQYFELTEFQYFNHWVFVGLIGLFCVTLTVSTVRRIPFNPRNLGVLTVHTGLLVLCAGSVVYFGGKIEGDVLLEAPRIQILSTARARAGQNAVFGTLAAAEGEVWDTNMPMIGGHYRVEVGEVRHKGMETGAQVELSVTVGDDAPRSVSLGRDGSQPHSSRLNEHVFLSLEPANAENRFYDQQTPVLIVTHGGDEPQTYELPQLPYYHERSTQQAVEIHDTSGQVVASSRCWSVPGLEQWQMPIELNRPDSNIQSAWPMRIEIDGYLPYAELRSKPVPGGSGVNPIVKVGLTGPSSTDENWILAMFARGSMLELADGTAAEFRWLDEDTEIDERWTGPLEGRHVLDVFVKDQGVHHQYDVNVGSVVQVEGTDYRLKVEQLRPSWPLMTAGFEQARTPIALVWVESPTRSFQRSVLERYPQLNQDRDRAGKKILDAGGLVDENLDIRYFDASRDHFMLFAGNDLAPTVIHTAPGGKRTVRTLKRGETFAPYAGASLTLEAFIVRPTTVTEPVVIPLERRRPLSDVRRTQSLVRVHVQSTIRDWETRVWIPFSQYNLADPMTQPTRVDHIPELGTIRVVYGRAVRRLPTRLVLERLKTDYYPGREQASGWTSTIRYEDPESGQTLRRKVWLNNTATIGRWTFYQANAASDGVSFTGLGVGNRDGVLTMLGGCALIALGMVYAFCAKPLLIRRRKRRLAETAAAKRQLAEGASAPAETHGTRRELVTKGVLLFACLVGLAASRAAAEEPAAGGGDLAAIQGKIDLDTLGMLVLQHHWRYSTIESWARDSMKAVHGSKPWDGLEPVVAAVELVLNREAHDDEPVIYIKDRPLRKQLTAHPIRVSEAERKRILKTGMVARSFFRKPAVAARLRELSVDMTKSTAMGRLFRAINSYEDLGGQLTMVPALEAAADTPWLPVTVLSDAAAVSHLPGLEASRAKALVALFGAWRAGWQQRDAAAINTAVKKLAEVLPTLAPSGVYPTEEQRRAEVFYRRADLMWWAWVCYIFSFFISIFAVAARYRWARYAGLFFLLGAMGLHGYDLAVRWQVIGRIPVANMYEAVVSSTWVGVVFALVLELLTKKRVYLLGAGLLGFFALSLPELLSDRIDNSLANMMPILDDIMLRIHTVLIISSYAVITLAFAVANCYLVVSAFRKRVRLAQGTLGAQLGLAGGLIAAKLGALNGLNGTTTVLALIGGTLLGIVVALFVCEFVLGLRRPAAGAFDPSDFPIQRDVLKEFDLSHRVLLYTAMVALFVGLVLGAVWADYSWGRPWGWDPKEVFALNTWLIYVILIHARFVTKRRELWTAVLSVFGFVAMQFNWWVVNFYIVGLHSYA